VGICIVELGLNGNGQQKRGECTHLRKQKVYHHKLKKGAVVNMTTEGGSWPSPKKKTLPHSTRPRTSADEDQGKVLKEKTGGHERGGRAERMIRKTCGVHRRRPAIRG